MFKTDSVKVAVYVAAMILTYQEHHWKERFCKDEVNLKQSDIRVLAEELCTKKVHSARISQWYNSDHEKNTYNFFRAKDKYRRLTAIGELNYDKEYPEELSDAIDEMVTLNDGRQVTIFKMHKWFRDIYSSKNWNMNTRKYLGE
jgi:hypothetical protein